MTSIRKLERLDASFNTALIATLLRGDSKQECQILDFHSEAIRIRVANLNAENLDGLNLVISINAEPFRIIALNPENTRIRNDNELIVVLGDSKSADFKERAARFNTNFQASLRFIDPNSSTRSVLANILNYSDRGLKVQTSLSNKHLTGGMKIFNLRVDLSIGHITITSAKIVSAKYVNNRLELGIEILSDIDEFQQLIFKFALVSGENIESLDFIKEKNKAKITDVVSIHPIHTSSDVEDVKGLRYLAYSCANKLDKTATVDDLWDEYDERSIILLVKVGRTVIGTVRMTRSNSSLTPFYFQKYFKYTPDGDLRDKYYEVTRLAIHPSFQGTDIVIAIFSYVFEMVLKANLEGVYCFCTPNLLTHYKRLSGRVISKDAVHPVTGDKMFLLRLDRMNVIRGQKMPSLSWLKVSKAVVDHLNRYSYQLPRYNMRYHRIKAATEKLFLKLLSRKRAKKK